MRQPLRPFQFNSFSHWQGTLLSICLCLHAGCGPGPDPKSLKNYDSSKLPADPVISSFSYIQNASTMQETGPFPVSRLIYPDLETGSCSANVNHAEITLTGTFDELKTTTLELTGPTSSVVNKTGSSFTIVACVSSGATLLTLRAKNADDRTSPGQVSVSLVIRPRLKTLAEGHPKYPSPGFRAQGGAVNFSNLVSNGTTARQIVASDTSQTEIDSTNAAGYSLSVGFANIVRLESP